MNKETVNSSEIYKIINQEIENPQIITLDRKYKIPSQKNLQMLLNRTAINEAKYVSDLYDCENFSFHLMSVLALKHRINAFGTVISYKSRHAFNLAIVKEDGEYKIYKVEPQSDKMWELKEDEKEKYITDKEIILI